MKRKPKFRVGQVVCVNKQYLYAGVYGRIQVILNQKAEPFEYLTSSAEGIFQERQLRPLTKRERGGR